MPFQNGSEKEIFPDPVKSCLLEKSLPDTFPVRCDAALSTPGYANQFQGSGAPNYFQLQLGMKFWPDVVSCFCCVPSTSMDQICVLPPMVRSKTMWRLSGDQEG